MQDKEDSSTAIGRLRATLPYIFGALDEAKQVGVPTLAIAGRHEDGSGKMILTIDKPEEFLRDIAEVCGVSTELTDEQKAEYEAEKFISKFGLRSISDKSGN